MGYFLPIRTMTTPTFSCDPCLTDRRVECWQQPWFTFFWRLICFWVTFGLLMGSGDTSGSWFGIYHWGIILSMGYWALVQLLVVITRGWSYEMLTSSTDYAPVWRTAWFCHAVGYPIMAVGGPVYGIYHRDYVGATQTTDALVWFVFSVVLVDLSFFKMPFVPTHVVWLLALVLLDAVVMLGVYGSTRLTFLETMVAFLFLILWYGVVSLVAYVREKFGSNPSAFTLNPDI